MMKRFINLLSSIFPKLFVNFAYHQLTHPQVKKLRDNEIEVLNTANKSRFKFQSFDIQLYEWRGDNDSVLLIHGWEGQAGNFSDIIIALKKANYTIYAFDAPSHGYSSSGKTSLFEFTELVGLLIQRYRVRKLISHSFGGVATTYALSQMPDYEIEKYLLLTTPDKFSERINDVVEAVGISTKVQEQLIGRLKRELNVDPMILNVSEFVKEINVSKALIIHDKNDKVIPITRARNVANSWINCSVEEVDGTGHFRILRTPEVIRKGLDFIKI